RIQQFQLFAPVNHRRQVVLHQARFFSWHEARQYPDWLADAVLAHRNPLVCARHAKPVRARLLQRLRYFRSAVPVAIPFDDGENLARRIAFFVRRVYVLADRFQILRERAKRNFRPYRASHFFVGSFPCACHVPSEKFSVRHSHGSGLPPATLAAAWMTTPFFSSSRIPLPCLDV